MAEAWMSDLASITSLIWKVHGVGTLGLDPYYVKELAL